MRSTALLTMLIDDVTQIGATIRAATAADGPHGRQVTLAELGRILLAGGRLVAHVGGMIAGGHHA